MCDSVRNFTLFIGVPTNPPIEFPGLQQQSGYIRGPTSCLALALFTDVPVDTRTVSIALTI